MSAGSQLSALRGEVPPLGALRSDTTRSPVPRDFREIRALYRRGGVRVPLLCPQTLGKGREQRRGTRTSFHETCLSFEGFECCQWVISITRNGTPSNDLSLKADGHGHGVRPAKNRRVSATDSIISGKFSHIPRTGHGASTPCPALRYGSPPDRYRSCTSSFQATGRAAMDPRSSAMEPPRVGSVHRLGRSQERSLGWNTSSLTSRYLGRS